MLFRTSSPPNLYLQTIVSFALLLPVAAVILAVVTLRAVGKGAARTQTLSRELAVRDTTDQKEVEAAINSSEVKYRRLFQSAKDGILILDAASARITDANPFISELLDYKQEELLGKELWEIGLFRDVGESKAAMEELQEKSYIRYEDLPLETKGGRRVDVEFVSNVYREGDHTVIQCNIRDITERRQGAEALRESRARLRFALDSAEVGEWDLDLVRNTARRSLRHDQAFGYNEPVKDWGFDTFLQHVDPADRARVERRFREAVAELNDWRVECRVNWPDGSQHWIAVHGSIYRTPGGEPTHMLGIVANITERKRLENELRQTAANLSESDRRKTEFLGMLAHELRNPLAPIRNAAQVMRLTAGNDNAVASASDMIERQVGHMVHLVDDLLDVSRISRGKIELRKERIELASVVNHAVEAAQSLVKCTEHDLTVRLPDRPLYLSADPNRLTQLLGNLLSNACKFTEQGGRIWLTVEREADHAVIRVRDTGIGITADQRLRIFDMFVQVDTSLDRSVGGLGIGLTLVRSIVEMHGGSVEVHSPGVGQGSEFVVRLPIMVAPLGPVSAEPTASSPPFLTPRRILVVD